MFLTRTLAGLEFTKCHQRRPKRQWCSGCIGIWRWKRTWVRREIMSGAWGLIFAAGVAPNLQVWCIRSTPCNHRVTSKMLMLILPTSFLKEWLLCHRLTCIRQRIISDADSGWIEEEGGQRGRERSTTSSSWLSTGLRISHPVCPRDTIGLPRGVIDQTSPQRCSSQPGPLSLEIRLNLTEMMDKTERNMRRRRRNRRWRRRRRRNRRRRISRDGVGPDVEDGWL